MSARDVELEVEAALNRMKNEMLKYYPEKNRERITNTLECALMLEEFQKDLIEIEDNLVCTMGKFRKNLRDLLSKNNIKSSPEWTEEEIVKAYSALFKQRLSLLKY